MSSELEKEMNRLIASSYIDGCSDTCDVFIKMARSQMMKRCEAIELGDLVILLEQYKSNAGAGKTNDEAAPNGKN